MGGTGPAFNDFMILALGIFISAFGSIGLLSLHLSKAPRGFEDESGFHFAENSEESAVKGGSEQRPALQSGLGRLVSVEAL
jgi:hypothetical protein